MGGMAIADGGAIAFPQLIGIARILRIDDERVTWKQESENNETHLLIN